MSLARCRAHNPDAFWRLWQGGTWRGCDRWTRNWTRLFVHSVS